MTTLLADLTMRSSAILLIGLVLCAALRHRSAALRHFVLACAIFASGAVIPLTALLPVWSVAWPVAVPPETVPAGAIEVTTTVLSDEVAPPAAAAVPLAGVVWALGFALCATVLIVALGRLTSVATRARRVTDGRWVRIAAQVGAAYRLWRPVRVLQTDAPDVLATFGFLRPRVLLPAHAATWSDARIHAVLCHELAHVRRHDWFVQMGAEALRTLYWFNPLIWLACSRLRRESEQACDDAVLAEGVPPRDYAALLLELACLCRRPGPAWVSAVPMARPSTLERRITAMLNPALNRRALSRRAIAVAAALVTLITLPVAAFRAEQSTPQTLGGTVYDPSGGVLPQVELTLEDAQQQKQQATTDRAGRFAFQSVAPGRYVLEAKLAGFRSLRQEFELRTVRDWDRAITLQVGELKETIHIRAARVTVPTGPSQAQAPQPLRVGGNIRVPRKVLDVKPVYPTSMREAGREGTVPMEAVIGPDGSVVFVRVLSANVHPDFAIAAVDAVRQWRFDPTLLNGKPVDVRMMVSVEFSLSEQ